MLLQYVKLAYRISDQDVHGNFETDQVRRVRHKMPVVDHRFKEVFNRQVMDFLF